MSFGPHAPSSRSKSGSSPRTASGPLGATDLTRWRLDSSDGRHCWHYVREPDSTGGIAAYEELWGDGSEVRKRRKQNDEEKYALGLLEVEKDVAAPAPGTPLEAARLANSFYKRLQASDGHWSGDFGGPLFITPCIVFANWVCSTPLPEEYKIEISRYLANTQRQGEAGDEGWGLHTEGVSTVFGTVMNYVVMRLLGVGADEPLMIKARATLHHHGGAAACPTWAKVWLSIMNLYSYDGCNPLPVELWLLPHWFPASPMKMWAYNRNVMLPLTYLYSKRFSTPLTPLLQSIREEIFTEPYASIDWPIQRNNIAQVDLYAPHPVVLDLLYRFANVAERFHSKAIRKKALEYAYSLIVMEDENTSYTCQAPINKSLNAICRWEMEGPDSEAFRLHKTKYRDFLWVSQSGMFGGGTNGSQLWDAAFIAQALHESGLDLESENRESVTKLLHWLDECQIRVNPKYLEVAGRHQSKGAWPFSIREQAYTVSDCTAEGLKAVLYLQSIEGMPKLVTPSRQRDAVDVILSLQNTNGGFASCELIRGSSLLELLNPAEVFRDIMVEVAYVECTTACVTSLATFQENDPEYRSSEIQKTIRDGILFIKSAQRADGSFYGSWAVCFTYATMFALESFALVGETCSTSNNAQKACQFLLSKQRANGGWGEDFTSCEKKEYIQHEDSQVVNTSWALIGLIVAKCPDTDAIRRGCQLIMSRQKADGRFEQEGIEGGKHVFISFGFLY